MNKLLLFIIICLSPIFAELIHPPDGNELSYIHVMFQWDAVEESIGYNFQLSTSNDFSSLKSDITTSDLFYIEKNNIDWESNYYWRARSIGGEWINIFNFTTGESSVTFQNDDMPIKILKYNPELVSNGITIFGSYYNNYSAAIDMNGNEVWNSGGVNSFVFFNRGENHELFGGSFLSDSNNALIGCEFSVSNGILWREPVDEVDLFKEVYLQHEIIKLPNGNFMGIVPVIEKHPVPISENFPSRDTVFSWEDDFDDEIEYDISYPWKGEKIVEWDNNTGLVVWEWNVFDYYSMNDFDYLSGNWEAANNSGASFDWIHFNAIVFSSTENAVYVSSRHLSRITKIDYSTKEIIWNVGLQWLGDTVIMPDTLFSGQHGLQLLPNGNLVTFDNGILSQIIEGISKPVSRGIEIAITENNGNYNAEIVYSHILHDSLYGALSGNAQKLQNGNYLLTTIGNTSGAYSIEVTPTHEIAWMCKYNLGTYSIAPMYRAMRIPGIFESESQILNISQLSQPSEFRILSIYPNPFNPLVNIEYEIIIPTLVNLEVINLKGQIVDIIEEGFQFPGQYKLKWDGSNSPNGMYLIRLETLSGRLTKKIILLK